jgi:AraC-like DNA-binding protein
MLYKDLLIRLCRARDALRVLDERQPSIRQVARDSGLSPFHFIRLFKAVFGETPHQCRLQARLARAKHLLTVTDYSVTEVCMEVGFSSLGSFSYLFSHRVGISPSSYKRKVRGLLEGRGKMPKALTPGCFALMGEK